MFEFSNTNFRMSWCSAMHEKVAAACRDAGQQVIELAERTGTEIVIWRDDSRS